MLHLDLIADDLDEAVKYAIACGSRRKSFLTAHAHCMPPRGIRFASIRSMPDRNKNTPGFSKKPGAVCFYDLNRRPQQAVIFKGGGNAPLFAQISKVRAHRAAGKRVLAEIERQAEAVEQRLQNILKHHGCPA